MPCGLPALLAFCLAASAFAQQNDRARTESLARRAGERLQALQREADRLASQERSILGDLRKLDVERELKAEELKELDAQAAKVSADLDGIDTRVASLQRAELAARPALSARLVETYKLGRARYLRLLLSTSDVRRLGQATRALAALAKLDRDRVLSHERTVRELESARATLEARRQQLDRVRGDAQKAQAAEARAAAARLDLVRDIDRRRDLNAQLAGELEVAQQRIQATLRDLASGAAPAQPASLPLAPFRGDLPWPAAGTLARRFGVQAGGAAPSKGIEIATAEGAAAAAVHDGIVAFAGPFSGFGNLVILDHGSRTYSLYGDLLDVSVAKGARVDRGQPLGSAGPLPSGATGVYFELRVDGQAVDPLQWLQKR